MILALPLSFVGLVVMAISVVLSNRRATAR